MTSVAGAAALQLAAAVERRTNQQLKIEVYPSGQLAKEREAIDGLANGVIDLAIYSSSFLEPLFPRFQVFDMPFLFKDLTTGFRVLDGPVGSELLAELETKGIVGLGYGIAGRKELSTTNRAITVPDDMKGLRFRIVSGPIYVATYQALGAVPVTIDLAETYAALAQHTVDGIDVSLDAFTTGKYYSIVKHVALSNHVLSVMPLMASKRKVDALPPPLQKILREEGKAVIPYWRAQQAKRIIDDVAILKANGVAFTEIQYPLFRRAVDSVYDLIRAKLGSDYLDRVLRAAS